jgi:hypothetical protein
MGNSVLLPEKNGSCCFAISKFINDRVRMCSIVEGMRKWYTSKQPREQFAAYE